MVYDSSRAHYDLPTEVFRAFLSRDLTYVVSLHLLVRLLKSFVTLIVNSYSCAIFDDEAGRDTGDLLSIRPIAPPEGSPDDLERFLIVATTGTFASTW